MIKLERGTEPQYLADNKAQWLGDLQAAIGHYGGFSKIPKAERTRLIRHYKDEQVKTPLLKSSHEKCAFCESIPGETGYPEVDHFKPKSLYPMNVFDWDNLVPVCRKCNYNKLDHDTVSEPIIDPYTTDPETVFEYDDVRIKAKPGTSYDAAHRTIAICKLNDVRLQNQRSDILIALRALEQNLETAFAGHTAHDKLMNAVLIVAEFENAGHKLAGFCRAFLQNSRVYQSAKSKAAVYPVGGALPSFPLTSPTASVRPRDRGRG
jgi:uncharacterized protein (TIGR02646 family)